MCQPTSITQDSMIWMVSRRELEVNHISTNIAHYLAKTRGRKGKPQPNRRKLVNNGSRCCETRFRAEPELQFIILSWQYTVDAVVAVTIFPHENGEWRASRVIVINRSNDRQLLDQWQLDNTVPVNGSWARNVTNGSPDVHTKFSTWAFWETKTWRQRRRTFRGHHRAFCQQRYNFPMYHFPCNTEPLLCG